MRLVEVHKGPIITFIKRYMMSNFGRHIMENNISFEQNYAIVKELFGVASIRTYFQFDSECFQKDASLYKDLICYNQFTLRGNDTFLYFKKRPLTIGENILEEV